MLLSSSSGVLAFSIASLNTLFSLVFAYLGVKYAYAFFIGKGRSPLFSTIVIVVVFALLSSNAVSIFSYLGAVVNIAVNNSKKVLKDE